MCANFQPITQAQASRFTNQQLSFDFKDDIYSGYEAPLLFANLLSNTSGTQPCLEWCLNGPKIPILPNTLMMPVETVMDKPSFKRAWYNNQFALIPVQTIY